MEKINNMFTEDLPSNNSVVFDNGEVYGIGIVKGISGTGVPLLGKQYILEIENMFDKNTNDRIHYKYPCIAMHEYYLQLIRTR